MGWPSLELAIDTVSKSLDIPNHWTVIPGPRSFRLHQGRQQLLQRTEVGDCSLIVDIRAGVPTGLKDGNHLRLRATKDGVPYPLFRGFVQGAPREWPGEVDAISQIEAQDGFSLMSRYDLEGQAIASLQTGAHLEAVLTTFGWPLAGEIPTGTTWWQLGNAVNGRLGTTTFLGESLRFLEDGQSILMATTLTGNLLDHLLNAAETTEGGTFYIGPSGDVIFEQAPLAHDPVIGTWGPPPDLPYYSLSMRRDNSLVYNDIRLTNRGGSEYVIKDASSITDNGPRTLPQSDLLFSTEGQLQSRADDLLLRHKKSQEHPAQMIMRPKPDGPLWPYILGTKLGTRIRVKHQYGWDTESYDQGIFDDPGTYDGAEILTFECLVVGVTLDVGEFWEVTWDLAPAIPVLNAWYLGIEGSANLGTSTILG